MSEPALFSPESVTWKVHADPVMWVAGLRALLLQALHPAAMAGVLDHSDFRRDPWGRLLRTANFIGVVTYAPAERAHRAAHRVRNLHARVSGDDPVSGRHYSGDDQQLLLWVHCCLVDSLLDTFRRSGRSLTDEEADRYLAEQIVAAELVGLEASLVPTSRAALDGYFRAVQPELRADRRARLAARYVLFPPLPRAAWLTPARPVWAGVAGLAIALLPRWARRMYGLPVLPLSDHVATVELRALAATLHALPKQVLTGPHVQAVFRRAGVSPAA